MARRLDWGRKKGSRLDRSFASQAELVDIPRAREGWLKIPSETSMSGYTGNECRERDEREYKNFVTRSLTA